MTHLSSIILYFQGILAIQNGAINLLSSSAAKKNAEMLGIESIPIVHAFALSSITIGTFYLIAAKKRDKLAMKLSILGRTMAVLVFLRNGGVWRKVAIFEGVCGGLLAASLLWEVYY
ncbi:hypothetical protein ACMFMF_009825 [Clarireedia jacksonii]